MEIDFLADLLQQDGATSAPPTDDAIIPAAGPERAPKRKCAGYKTKIKK